MLLLAGDLGGTKCNLGLYRSGGGDADHELLAEATYASGEHPGLGPILEDFLARHDGARPDAVALGVPGAVYRGRARLVNLAWDLDAAALSAAVGGAPVRLMNDLEAFAWGIPSLDGSNLRYLQGTHPPPRDAAAAVLAPGTGFGVAYLAFDGTRQHPVGTEAGHTDFAPRREEEVRLLAFLQRTLPDHVCWEDVLAGPGLGNLYAFCRSEAGAPEHDAVAAARRDGDPNAEVARLGLAGRDACAARALGMFVRLLGAEAGNHALRVVARGGVFLAGGIPPKILPALEAPEFLEAFRAKAHYEELLASFPVAVVQDERTAVRGALAVARAAASS